MPRPRKVRRVCGLPQCKSFGPLDSASEEYIVLAIDEYETVRLIDLMGCSQEECAAFMKVARTTVQSIYDSARRKIAQALVEGRVLRIGGGSYELCSEAGCCCGGCPVRKGCRR